MNKRQLQAHRKLELDAQAYGIRRIYQDRRRRQIRRERIIGAFQWVIVAAIMVALAFTVYAGLQSSTPHPPALPTFEELP